MTNKQEKPFIVMLFRAFIGLLILFVIMYVNHYLIEYLGDLFVGVYFIEFLIYDKILSYLFIQESLITKINNYFRSCFEGIILLIRDYRK